MANETVKQWLLKQRLDNYGYDYKWFRKMGATKHRYSEKLRARSNEDIKRSLAKAGILGGGGRLSRVPAYKKIKLKSGKTKYVRSGKKQWDYTTGQSYNEEMINMIVLGGSKGKKSFWEIQDKWSQ